MHELIFQAGAVEFTCSFHVINYILYANLKCHLYIPRCSSHESVSSMHCFNSGNFVSLYIYIVCLLLQEHAVYNVECGIDYITCVNIESSSFSYIPLKNHNMHANPDHDW